MTCKGQIRPSFLNLQNEEMSDVPFRRGSKSKISDTQGFLGDRTVQVSNDSVLGGHKEVSSQRT